ncbi:MAG: hypothetical protein KKB37_17375, partial [Alphaproteobacteria bacterium]|nr:hypothetical protein [Alphaproteobacteria bacterium]
GRFNWQKFRDKGLNSFPLYSWQTSAYMGMSSKDLWPLKLIVRSRDDGSRLDLDIEEPPIVFSDIVDKLAWIAANSRVGKLTEGEFEQDSDSCRWCRFSYLCIHPEKKEITDGALLEGASLWREGKELEQKAKEMLGDARNRFETYSSSNNLASFKVADLNIQFQDRQRTSYDAKLLKELVPESILDQVVKITPYKELRVRDLRNG